MTIPHSGRPPHEHAHPPLRNTAAPVLRPRRWLPMRTRRDCSCTPSRSATSRAGCRWTTRVTGRMNVSPTTASGWMACSPTSRIRRCRQGRSIWRSRDAEPRLQRHTPPHLSSRARPGIHRPVEVTQPVTTMRPRVTIVEANSPDRIYTACGILLHAPFPLRKALALGRLSKEGPAGPASWRH